MKIRLLLLLIYIYCVPQMVAQSWIDFSEIIQNTGSIMWQQPIEVSYDFVNKSTREISITEVLTDCECTAATYTKAPIPPGGKGNIKVSFTANLLGHFNKSILVFTNLSEQPTTLRLTGDVVIEKQVIPDELPIKIGELQLSTNEIEYDDINLGDIPSKTIQIYNGSKSTYRPSLMHLPPYLNATCKPEVIRGGRKGEITITLDSRKLNEMGLSQSTIYLSRFEGDRIGQDKSIHISATLLPEAVNMPVHLEMAPIISIDSTLVIVASPEKKKVKGELLLTNKGRTPLEIKKLQVYNPSIGVSLPKRVIQSGETVKLKVSVNRQFKDSHGRFRILMITNDPRHGKVTIDVLQKNKQK